ncbi:uncharacterized protein [Dendrobates tinctorius]|uniref:uncharacterized protein n=1 Tax=Dendrobates tinctorius TaxID=92724 RepID=UPI003CCA32A2
MRFFGWKQRAQDSIRDYALNLQEALRAIKQIDPDRVKDGDRLLKEQFIEGLLSSAHRAQLRIIALQNPDLDFADFKGRAIRVLHEPNVSRLAPPRYPAITYHQEAASFPPSPVGADAQTLDNDPSTELRLQVQELAKNMAALAKTVQCMQVSKEKIQLASSPEDVPWLRKKRIPPHRGRNNDRYDQNGRPICHRCCKAGHIARFCHPGAEGQPPGVGPQGPKNWRAKYVGGRPVLPVVIDGIPMNALLDTGSQVTTMPYILYKRYWADSELTRVPSDELTVVASNGQSLPRVECKEITIKVG